MSDRPINPAIRLSEDEAERILACWLQREVIVHAVRRLTGGCVNTVVRVDYDDGQVVAKLSNRHNDTELGQECEILDYFERVPAFRVPRVLYRDISCTRIPYSFFIMEYLPGINLADAASFLSVPDRIVVERQIALAVVRLHEHKRDKFGLCVGQQEFERWSDCFLDRFDQTVRDIQDQHLLDRDIVKQIERIRNVFPRLLDTDARPTLSHGDIWATNIILSPSNGRWSLVGFVDPGGLFELAYLDIWNTVGKTFYEVYRQYHVVEDVYEVRRLFYWLHTLLIHVRAFKTDYYRSATVSLVNQLTRFIRRSGR